MRKRILRFASVGLAVIVAFLGLTVHAHAVLVTHEFTGFLTVVAVRAQPSISVNDPFSGSFTYDTEATRSSQGSGGGVRFHNYFAADALVSIDITLGGLNATETQAFDTGFIVRTGREFNTIFSGFTIQSTMSGNTIDNNSIDLIELTLSSTINDLFDINGTPPLSLDLADFESAQVRFDFNPDARGFGTVGVLTSLNLVGVIVPEPSTLLLLGFGLAGLGFFGRRKIAA